MSSAEEFKGFQYLYLAVYLIMTMADWLQVRTRIHTHSVACCRPA
jgi:hypothetical protein